MNLRQTLRLIRSDCQRAADLFGDPLNRRTLLRLLMTPGVFCLMLFRLSHWLYQGPFRPLGWVLYGLNITITGADIVPYCQIGPRAFVGHPVGIGLGGVFGENLTIFGHAGVAGGVTHPETGERTLPVVGDNVQIGYNASIIGPWRIGNDVLIAPHSYVNSDVPDYHVAYGAPAKKRLRTGDEDVVGASVQKGEG